MQNLFEVEFENGTKVFVVSESLSLKIVEEAATHYSTKEIKSFRLCK